MAEQQEGDTFAIVTTAQVERTYHVQAVDEDQGRDRLRSFLKDPAMLAEGVVVEQPDAQIDSTPQRIRAKDAVKKLPRGPRAVEEPAAGAAAT